MSVPSGRGTIWPGSAVRAGVGQEATIRAGAGSRSRVADPRPGPPRLALLTGLALAIAGCGGSPDAPLKGQGPGAPVATAMATLSPEVGSTVALLQAAVAGAGYRLDPPATAYRPSEPGSLVDVPRAVLRASTPDTGQGFVVVYDLPDAVTAVVRARDMASHVGSGFGQTNFPPDAQFHVASLGDTVVFTWWSRAAASDPAAAQAVFDALRTVGTQVPVVK